MSAGKAARLTRVRFLHDCGIHNAWNMARAQSTQVRFSRDRGPSVLLMDERLELMALFARPRPVASDCCSSEMPQRFAGGGIGTTDAKSAGEEPRLRDASAEEPEEAIWQMQHLQLKQAQA